MLSLVYTFADATIPSSSLAVILQLDYNYLGSVLFPSRSVFTSP